MKDNLLGSTVNVKYGRSIGMFFRDIIYTLPWSQSLVHLLSEYFSSYDITPVVVEVFKYMMPRFANDHFNLMSTIYRFGPLSGEPASDKFRQELNKCLRDEIKNRYDI